MRIIYKPRLIDEISRAIDGCKRKAEIIKIQLTSKELARLVEETECPNIAEPPLRVLGIPIEIVEEV